MRRARTGPECGSATVLVLACVLAACLISGWWIQVTRAGVARQRAETAADLAALAGARSAGDLDGASPCAVAASVARANGARLEICSLADSAGASAGISAGIEVTVVVSSPVTARSSAHAGPASNQ